VDINSGLNGDSGLTNLAVKSDLTVSIGTVKVGLVLGMAKDYAKNVVNLQSKKK
jgi:NAD(P)H-hydrate epimerase